MNGYDEVADILKVHVLVGARGPPANRVHYNMRLCRVYLTGDTLSNPFLYVSHCNRRAVMFLRKVHREEVLLIRLWSKPIVELASFVIHPVASAESGSDFIVVLKETFYRVHRLSGETTQRVVHVSKE